MGPIVRHPLREASAHLWRRGIRSPDDGEGDGFCPVLDEETGQRHVDGSGDGIKLVVCPQRLAAGDRSLPDRPGAA
ncbi:hypothetical protein D1872_346760 [compost metagenome]